MSGKWKYAVVFAGGFLAGTAFISNDAYELALRHGMKPTQWANDSQAPLPIWSDTQGILATARSPSGAPMAIQVDKDGRAICSSDQKP